VGLHIDLDAEPGRLVDQKARRADAPLAEMKVVADRDAADPEPKVITTAPASPVPANSRNLAASSVRRN
jgi:hypothetical protein